MTDRWTVSILGWSISFPDLNKVSYDIKFLVLEGGWGTPIRIEKGGPDLLYKYLW
jgi:hypothetical protein